MTSGSDIAFASAEALAELYRRKALSPVEAAEILFARIEALQPKLNAFCIVDRDGALAAARASQQRWRQGKPLGPLDGVPVTIKDLVLMRGFPTLEAQAEGIIMAGFSRFLPNSAGAPRLPSWSVRRTPASSSSRTANSSSHSLLAR